MPRKEHNLVALDVLDRALDGLRSTPPRPPSGWIRATREALGMSRAQLAARVGVAAATLATIERSEEKGTISMTTLDKVARGLGAKVVYGFVPIRAQNFEGVLQERADAVARRRLKRVSHTMALEDQGLDKTSEATQLKRAVDRALAGSRRALWRQP